MTKPIKLFGHKVTERELFDYIKNLIDQGKTGTSEIAQEIGRSTKQAKRYLNDMAGLGMISVDPQTNRIAITTQQSEADKIEALNMDEFTKHPVIKKWLDECETRIKAKTLVGYKNSIKRIFKELPENPKYVVASRGNALQYWANYQRVYKQRTGRQKVSQPLRVAFRNLLDCYGISFGHKMGKKHGLGSEHDAYKKYRGISLFKHVPKLLNLMLESKDYESHLWFLLGLRTSARASALASMTWERIYFDNVDEDGTPAFKVEIHETKVPKGHYHLGHDGNWFDYHLPDEVKEALLRWKSLHPEFRRFVFFEDAGADVPNKRKADYQHDRMAGKLAAYYKQIEGEFEPLLKEYIKKRPDHVMCHTFAQMCKNQGMSNEEIAEAGHWTDPQSVDWYCGIEAEKKKAISKKVAGMSFEVVAQ